MCVVGATVRGMRFGCRLSALSSRCLLLMRCAGRSGYSSAVDIFDASSGKWKTTSLSVARGLLAATSLPNQGLAIFAGLFFDFLFAIDVAACCVVCEGSERDAFDAFGL